MIHQLTRLQLLAIGLILALICFISAVVAFSYGSFQRIHVKPSTSVLVSPTPEPSPDPLAPYSILLLGYGGGGHAGGKLTDTMMVATVYPRLKKIFLITIPRDVWVAFPSSDEGETHWKVNAAYAIGSDQRNYSSRPAEFKGEAGGGELAKYAISKIIGQPIKYFISVNFAGFEKSIDVLGGVKVMVERSFDDYLYPIEGKEEDSCDKIPEEVAATATLSAEQAEKEFPCRYEHLHFDRGQMLMDGETALKFARSRHGVQDGGDFGRSARQRSVLVAVKERLFEINFIPKAIPFVSTLAGNLETDIPLSQMQEWVSQAEELQSYQIYSIALTDQNVFKPAKSANGQYIMIPQSGSDQWQAVQEFIHQEIDRLASSSAVVP